MGRSGGGGAGAGWAGASERTPMNRTGLESAIGIAVRSLPEFQFLADSELVPLSAVFIQIN